MSAKVSPTGLYQFVVKQGDRLCVDCINEVLEANPGMRRDEWRPARIDDFDAEACDACDCVPAAEIGKVMA
jgi:hypothetical protein